jgi:regulator of replication initiation timing
MDEIGDLREVIKRMQKEIEELRLENSKLREELVILSRENIIGLSRTRES